MSFERQLGNERSLVVINYNNGTSSTIIRGLPANATLTPLFPAGASISADSNGIATINLGARGILVANVN